MIRRVRIATELLKQIETEAHAASPRECCGLLVGQRHTLSSPVYGGGGSARQRRDGGGKLHRQSPPSASLTSFARHLPRKRGRITDAVEITAIHSTANIAAEDNRFEIDPQAQFALLRALRGSARGIIGCYHSHPNGRGEPSPRDVAGASEAGFLWLIAAIDPQGACIIAGFVFSGDRFVPVEICER